jgi:hypothetical protein
MADDSVVWLVNGENVVVRGTAGVVVTQLNAGRGALTALDREDRLYVNPNHVTHVESVRPADETRPMVDVI